MKNLRIVMCVALALGMLMPTNSDAGVLGTTEFTGNVGIGRAPAGSNSLILRVAVDPENVISVQNDAGASVFQMTVNGNGHGQFKVKNASNVVNVNFEGNNTSSILKGLAIGTTASGGAMLNVAGTSRCEILEITGGSDLAEQFDISGENPEPGTVVCIDPLNPGALVINNKAYDRTVAGIISGAGGLNTGMKMGQLGSVADGSHPVALTGRVYVKADSSNGAILPGDLLTTSTLAGHAMKVTEYGQAQGAIIGKAMTGLSEGTGLVLVLVSLQ